MAAAIGLRDDYDAGALRTAAIRSKDGPQARRLLALAAIYDGSTRTEPAKIGGVGLQVVRDWVLKFNAHGPDGLQIGIGGRLPIGMPGRLRRNPQPNITLIPLPAKCPELNPQENVWEFMRDNWLSNRIFKSFDDIVDHCCDPWNKLIVQPWRIMSIGLRDWLYAS